MTKETPTSQREQGGRKRRSSVTLYLTLLFVTAFLLLVLAYFMQERAYAQTDLVGQTQAAVYAMSQSFT